MTLDSGELSQLAYHKSDHTRRSRSRVRQPKPADQQNIIVPKGIRHDDEDQPLFLTRRSHNSVSIIGRRKEMEDTLKIQLGLPLKGTDQKFDFFGVYDGHGGSTVAEACRERLHKVVEDEMTREIGEVRERKSISFDWERVMVNGFERMDEEVAESGKVEQSIDTMGSTAVVAVVGEDVVVVANCGDSRGVLCRGGVAVPLSVDHKPDRHDELERIEGAGGRVINWNGYRVLGVLATSRSIGDQCLKPFVIAKPEVTVTKREDRDEFLILASDGLWDVVSNKVACKVVRRCLKGGMRHQELCYEYHAHDQNVYNPASVLAELAMARGSNDNISVIVIQLTK